MDFEKLKLAYSTIDGISAEKIDTEDWVTSISPPNWHGRSTMLCGDPGAWLLMHPSFQLPGWSLDIEGDHLSADYGTVYAPKYASADGLEKKSEQYLYDLFFEPEGTHPGICKKLVYFCFYEDRYLDYVTTEEVNAGAANYGKAQWQMRVLMVLLGAGKIAKKRFCKVVLDSKLLRCFWTTTKPETVAQRLSLMYEDLQWEVNDWALKNSYVGDLFVDFGEVYSGVHKVAKALASEFEEMSSVQQEYPALKSMLMSVEHRYLSVNSEYVDSVEIRIHVESFLKKLEYSEFYPMFDSLFDIETWVSELSTEERQLMLVGRIADIKQSLVIDAPADLPYLLLRFFQELMDR